jgi:putative endonuclease
MHVDHIYFVYIVASRSRNLYIGVTNSLMVRIPQHRKGTNDGHTRKFKIHRLVYFESFAYINNAIAREKELKGWLRSRKIQLIESINPTWEDLFLQFSQPTPPLAL